ncbi:MAG: transposase [Thermosediminibacterales bacterium]|jgi:hypothetical protein|nr:transposase [Thermosediminibacterales bacterium]
MDSTSITTIAIEELQRENALLRQENAELTAKLNWFMEQFRINQRHRFGRSSKQTIPEQISLFNEAEAEVKPDLEEPIVEEIIYKRKKKRGKREEQLKDLPVETIEY